MDDYKIMSHGASMKEYLEEVAKERSSMSLTLRRTKRPTIAAIRPGYSGSGSRSRSPALEKELCPFLNPIGAISYIQSNNPEKLAEMALGIESCINTNQRMLDSLISSEEFATEIVSALVSDEISESCKTIIFQIISSMFVAYNITSEYYIDNGLSFNLLELLSSDSMVLVQNSVKLVRQLAGNSYAKDSFLCLGIHDVLIDIAKQTDDEGLCEECCTAICSIFENIEEIDSTVLNGALVNLVQLLQLQSPNSVRAVITSLVFITNQQPTLIYTLYDLNVDTIIMTLLQNDVTCGPSLILLENMCCAHTTNLAKLIEHGVFEILQNLLQTEHAGGVFAVLSTLLETLPSVTIPFAMSIYEGAIELTQTCGFETKKEVTFFVATLILFVSMSDLEQLISEEVLELITEMLGCSINLVIKRCLDAIQRSAICIQAGGFDISESSMTDLTESLEHLSNSTTSTTVREHAAHILEKIYAIN